MIGVTDDVRCEVRRSGARSERGADNQPSLNCNNRRNDHTDEGDGIGNAKVYDVSINLIFRFCLLHMPSIASELAPVSISASDINVRIFRLNLHNVTVELSSLGATITKILLPNYKHPNQNRDDIVLSYASPEEQYRDNNSVYFGAIVGRVANRIKNGQFQLHQTEMAADGSSEERLETYQLDINNSPNHLHGGFDGFSSRNWDADIVNNAVQFTLVSSYFIPYSTIMHPIHV